MGDKAFNIGNIITCSIIAIICMYPFYYIILYSISDPQAASKGVFLFPSGITLKNYMLVFKVDLIFHSFLISALRAIVGTVLTLLFSSLLAFLVTKKELPFRKLIYRMVVFTLFINAGIIPWYMTMLGLGLKNHFLLYVLPSAVGAFYVVLLKTYFEQLPPSLEESASIDGAGIMRIFFVIILPLSLPIVAAVAVFSAVGQWNSWYDNFFLVTDPKLKTLQLVLLEFLQRNMAEMMARDNSAASKAVSVTPMAIRMTISVVSILPVFIVYPLLQKYFIKGILIGAVKG
jgi:putative aldouronate transport system permease protein